MFIKGFKCVYLKLSANFSNENKQPSITLRSENESVLYFFNDITWKSSNGSQ